MKSPVNRTSRSRCTLVSRARRRRGSALPLVAVCMPVVIGFAALAVDVGYLYDARAQLQRTADATALAGASVLVDEGRLKGGSGQVDSDLARERVTTFAALNPVLGSSPSVASGDITIGRLNNPSNLNEEINTDPSAAYNTISVTIRRDATVNGPVNLFFARIFGRNTANLSATAAATYEDNVIGFAAPASGDNVMLLPIAVDVNTWQAFVDGTLKYGDGYTYNPDPGTVVAGADDIPELNIYPGGGGNQGGAGNGGGSIKLTPGNWGTVNIGVTNNSTATLGAQIRYGITPEQMAMYPDSELKLDSSGELELGGNPGISAGIKDDLDAIIGQTRTIPLYSAVSGNGNNAVYTVVGFAGVRIMAVKLTGSVSSKYVLAQSAIAVDRTTVTTGGSGKSYNVYHPLRLTR